MAYIDPTFNASEHSDIVGDPSSGVALGTVTASATQTYTGTVGTLANGVFRMPVFRLPTRILGIRIYCTGAAGAGVTGVTFNFLNGTSTLGSTTAPAVNTYVDATLGSTTFDSHGVETGAILFTSSGGEMTMFNTAIGTASASSLGSYAMELSWRNLFVS